MVDVLAAPEAARLTEFSRAFKAAARAVVLYPDGHPAIATTLGRLARITSASQLSAPLRISVAPDTLLLAGSAPPRPDAAIGEVAALLHAHLVGELTISPGGDQQAWRGFLLLVGRAPDVVRHEGGISRLWAATAGRHVEIREIDYAEVLRERSAGEVATWQQVVGQLPGRHTIRAPRRASEGTVRRLHSLTAPRRTGRRVRQGGRRRPRASPRERPPSFAC